MCGLNVRTLDPERDLDAYLALFNQVRARPVTRQQWLQAQARAGEGMRLRLVGESAGRVVSIASLVDAAFAADAVSTWIATDPERRRQGHGRAMMAAAEEALAERRPAEIWTDVRDDDAESLAWAERRGFAVFNHTFASRLDLAAFDPAPHRYAVENAEAAGLRFTPFGSGDDPDRLYELYARLFADAPDDSLRPPDRARFQREVLDRAGTVTLLACAGDEPVGLAIVVPHGDDQFGNALTGVVPDHRGRGLARALKVLSAEAARAAGARWLVTGNNARNAPMLAVNEALGYRREAGILHLRRRA